MKDPSRSATPRKHRRNPNGMSGNPLRFLGNSASLKRVNVVTYGPVVPEFEREILKSGKEIGLVNARYIKPLDENVLRMLAGRKAIVYEEVVRQGSLGMMMLASAEKAGLAIDFEFNAVPDMYVEHGEVDKIKKDLGLAIKDILAKC